MGSQTLGRDNSLSLPSLVRRRVSGVPPWCNGQSAGHMIGRLGVRNPHDRKVGGSKPTCATSVFSSVFSRSSSSFNK